MSIIKKNFLLFTGNHNKEGIADYVEAIKQKSHDYDFNLTISNILDFNYDGIFIIENFGDFTAYRKINYFLTTLSLIIAEFPFGSVKIKVNFSLPQITL